MRRFMHYNSKSAIIIIYILSLIQILVNSYYLFIFINGVCMKKSDIYYDLPERLIAQHPLERRDSSRLMVLDKKTGAIEHRVFSDLTEILMPGDCLILNDTRVLPARIYGEKISTGAVVEFLLLKQLSASQWECIVKPGKKAREGAAFDFSGIMQGTITQVLPLKEGLSQQGTPWKN